MRHEISADPVTSFFVVGIPIGGQHALGIDRYVRKGASPAESDPWVQIGGPPGKSEAVERFRTLADGKAWADERKRLKGTHCRVVACKGAVRG